MKRYELIWAMVRKIPRGRVATYGQIAELASLEGHARQVGYALHNLPAKNNVPWHRVVNAKGEISARSGGDSTSCSDCCSRRKGSSSIGPDAWI